MATTESVKAILTLISSALRCEVSDVTIEAWAIVLEEEPDIYLREATVALLKEWTTGFLPPPGLILARAREIRNSESNGLVKIHECEMRHTGRRCKCKDVGNEQYDTSHPRGIDGRCLRMWIGEVCAICGKQEKDREATEEQPTLFDETGLDLDQASNA